MPKTTPRNAQFPARFHTAIIASTALAFSIVLGTPASYAYKLPTLSAPGEKPKTRSFKGAFRLAQSDSQNGDQGNVNTQLDLAFWNAIKDSDNPGLYKAYLKKFPNGNFVIIAEEKLKALGSAPEPKSTSNENAQGENEQGQNDQGDNGREPDNNNRSGNDGNDNNGDSGLAQSSTITENGVGKLNIKTAFTLKAVSEAFNGLRFKKVKRPQEKGGATVFIAQTPDQGQIIVMGATKTVYSIVTNASMFADPNQVRVGDAFAKVKQKIKLDQCLVNPFPETFDQPGKVACFNQNSNLAYWFKFDAGQNQKEVSPSKISANAVVTDLQWAGEANEDTGAQNDQTAKKPRIEIETEPSSNDSADNNDNGGNNNQPQSNNAPDDSTGNGGANNGANALIQRGDDIINRARDEGTSFNSAAARAFKIYKQAQRKGSARASYKIARLYQRGFGGADAPRRARQFFTKAGRDGYPQGFVTLVNMLDKRGQPKPAANVLLLFFRTNPNAAINSLDRYSKRVLRAMQLKLRNTGYYGGPLDADIGQGTQSAIRAYSRAKGVRRKPIKRVRQQSAPQRPIDQPIPESSGRPLTAVKLIKRAQRQFRRLGCYSGPIDGIWGSGSARAARNFNRWTTGPRISETDLSRRTLNILKRNRGPVCGVD